MDAAAAYALDHARQRYDQAAAQLDHAREQYHAAIATQLANGATQAELATHTGYKREHIRRIARAHGIPPAR